MRGARSAVALLLSLGVLGWALPGATAARSGGLPPVPACLEHASTGVPCEGVYIKAANTPLEKQTNASGVFKLTAPPKATAPQRTKPVACGDIGCDYNHYDWIVYGGEKGSAGIVKDVGCHMNQPTCTITLATGGSQWTPVLVTLDDLPVVIFLLYR